jgi:hypothetical protein
LKGASKLKIIIQLATFLLLGACMVTSYNHGYDFVEEKWGFDQSWLVHVTVGGMDLILGVGVLALTWSRGKGLAPWFVFLIGLTFTSWSNVRSSYLIGDWEGVFFRSLTVLALMAFKLLLSWMSGREQPAEETDTKRPTLWGALQSAAIKKVTHWAEEPDKAPSITNTETHQDEADSGQEEAPDIESDQPTDDEQADKIEVPRVDSQPDKVEDGGQDNGRIDVPADAEAMAVQFLADNDRWPTYREFAELIGKGKTRAGEILREIKQKQEVM